MVLYLDREEEGGDGGRGTGGQQVRLKREYRRKKNRKLVSFLHRSNKDGAMPSSDELPILKQ